MPWQLQGLTADEVEALAKADAQRWERAGNLAAWILPWLPIFIAHGVAQGVGFLIAKDATLPDLPTFQKLLDSLPDRLKDETDG